MSNSAPKVTMSMPVRNGQRFIRSAIDSMLAQTFGDFELIICDNASTDATEQIVRDISARDPRVRYHRNPKDIGPANNHNVGLAQARGQYFRWHAHDDMIRPEYLATVVKILDEQPEVANAHTRTVVVDEQGEPLMDYDFRVATDSPSAVKRFGSLVLIDHHKHRACEIFGLMRTAMVQKWGGEGTYARGDSVLLARIALQGRYVEDPRRLFLYRSHGTQSVQTLPGSIKEGNHPLARYLGTGPLPPPEWWDSSLKGKIAFPEWRLFREYWVSISKVPLTAAQRFGCYRVMMTWLLFNPHKLARDLIFALEKVLTRNRSRGGGGGGVNQVDSSHAVSSAGGAALTVPSDGD
jgi:glycosyltransferase involved in cell wall biosynthesis